MSATRSGGGMVAPSRRRPLQGLAVDLVIAGAVGAALYLLFAVFKSRVLVSFTSPEIVLLEGGAIVLVAVLVARGVTNAVTRVLRRQGLANRGHAVRLFLNLLIAVGAVLALFRLAGVSADSVLLGAGFTGIVLGLASQTVLANVFAGLLLVFADPFRPGDRVSFVSSSYSVIWPSYPHETIYPAYAGTVEDIGLVYTVLALDQGGTAKVPNAVVIGALVLQPRGGAVHRVRLTLPSATSVAEVEAALPEVGAAFPPAFAGAPPPRVEVADLGSGTWDAVVIVHTTVRDAGSVRDRVLRILLARRAASGPAGPRPG